MYGFIWNAGKAGFRAEVCDTYDYAYATINAMEWFKSKRDARLWIAARGAKLWN